MAIEIREILIRALAGGQEVDPSKRKDKGCSEDEDKKQQDTMDMINQIMKNEKER